MKKYQSGFALPLLLLIVALPLFLIAVFQVHDIGKRAASFEIPEPRTLSCGRTCKTNSTCYGGFICYKGICRNPACPGTSSCDCRIEPEGL